MGEALITRRGGGAIVESPAAIVMVDKNSEGTSINFQIPDDGYFICIVHQYGPLVSHLVIKNYTIISATSQSYFTPGDVSDDSSYWSVSDTGLLTSSAGSTTGTYCFYRIK